MQRPLVSVIIPAYNAVATLERTLRSAAAQTYDRIEIIIVDDGSTDSTVDMANQFCADEPRARLIQQQNAGVAAARNAGIAAARGEWVAPLDADDLWHPTKIDRQVEAALGAPERPGFVYCWFHLIDEADQVIGSSEAYRAQGRALDAMLYFNFVGNGSSPLILRKAALKAGGYDPRFKQAGVQGCEDLALQLRLAREHSVCVVPKYLVGYRYMAGSMSQNAEKMHRSWQMALELFRSEGGPINPKAVRLNSAYRALRAAERLAGEGKSRDALRELWRAMTLDPGRSGAKLAHRLTKPLYRLVARKDTPEAPVMFENASTDLPLRGNQTEIPFVARALSRWDQRRMERFLH
jgi:glycosyltransferase involved in cell wall biosynthesis